MQTKIILALDELSLDACIGLISKLGDRVYAIKIHTMYDAEGPSVVQRFRDAGAQRVWVDAKLHDIPHTVQLRSEAIARSHADILSVHASGGVLMMKEAVRGFSSQVYAVTLLTSLKEEEVHAIYGKTTMEKVFQLARLAKLAGVHGVVCSANEVGFLSKQPELEGLLFVVPGVRSLGQEAADQGRIDTPSNAAKNGADYIIVGRQVTESQDPVAAFNAVEAELGSA